MSESVYVKVEYKSFSHVTRPARSDDEWDRDDIAHDLSIRGLRVVQERESWDFILKTPVQDEYWLVWYRYGTGDSFHREEGCHAFAHLCKTREDAKFLVQFIEKTAREKDRNFDTAFKDIHVELPSGDFAAVYPQWNGYFESFEGAEYEVFDLKG